MSSSLRPRGISITCFLLGWLSLAGFANTAMILLSDDVPIPRWFSFFALSYGITALVTTFKLWRMERTGVIWFRIWAAVVVATSIAMIPIFLDLALGGIAGMLGFVLFTAVLLWLVDQYVSRKLMVGY